MNPQLMPTPAQAAVSPDSAPSPTFNPSELLQQISGPLSVEDAYKLHAAHQALNSQTLDMPTAIQLMQTAGEYGYVPHTPGSNQSSPSAVPADKSAVANMILQKFGAAFGPDQAQAALKIAQMESGVNPLAANKTSSARGIWQFLASTAKNYGLPEDASQATPEQQTDAAVKYIASRYGDPQKALDFHVAKGWY